MSDPRFSFDLERSLARAARDIRPGIEITGTPDEAGRDRIARVMGAVQTALQAAMDAEDDLDVQDILVIGVNLPFLAVHIGIPFDASVAELRALHTAAFSSFALTVPSIARDKLRRIENGLKPS